MSDFVGIDITDVEGVREALKELPDSVADNGVETVNDYLLDVFRTYAQYQYISRKRIGWVSDKQRRYVMMQISKGNITVPYRRTQAMRLGWQTIGSGQNQIIVNETPQAAFVMGDSQSLRFNLMGWDTAQERVSDRMDKIADKFEEGANKAIKLLNLD
jgi:hypothetical protein